MLSVRAVRRGIRYRPTAAIVVRCITETSRIPSRKDMIRALKSTEEFDVLVIGGGTTGTGAALDGALRGLKVACVEREDFASGTSSRSTKLIWAGSRYLVQSFVELLSSNLIKSPIKTIRKFIGDFKMVMNCHRERRFLMDMQPHLTNWIPIAVPITNWILWPPPFNFWPAALGPLGIFTAFFKFYDAMGGFACPPSHLMLPKRAQRKFPQLANSNIKYCSIFYEGQHDDARTNLAIALTAAREGAAIANYCNVSRLLRQDDLDAITTGKSGKEEAQGPEGARKSGKYVAAEICDQVTGDKFIVRTKSILFCGGPFTDELRQLENKNAKKIVNGAGGIHVVLPAYYAPSGIGLVDMNTSDGRFLFFLPWEGHVLVGTTDHKQEASMRPEPSEYEIRWVLAEASKYLNKELHVRREDVLSAWSGIRPLVLDPDANEENTSAASRDHNISYNPESGIVYIAGGKWVTYREMAEDAIDKVIKVAHLEERVSRPCSTLSTSLVGKIGYFSNLSIRLVQDWGADATVAHRLASSYGGRAVDVLRIARDELGDSFKGGKLLVPGYPYLEAEVIFAVRHEWARFADDIIARRTRLAFLNKDLAIAVIPKVVQLMSRELKWNETRQDEEIDRALEYLRHFGGPRPAVEDIGDPRLAQTDKSEELNRWVERSQRRVTNKKDLLRAFHAVDFDNLGRLDRQQVRLMGEVLGHPLVEDEISECILSVFDGRKSTSASSSSSASVRPHESGGVFNEKIVEGVTFEEFSRWWNKEQKLLTNLNKPRSDGFGGPAVTKVAVNVNASLPTTSSVGVNKASP